MADLEFEEINRGNQPTQDGAGTDDAWTFTGKIIRNFNKLKAFLTDPSNAASRKVGTGTGDVMEVGAGGLLRAGRIQVPDFSNADSFVDLENGCKLNVGNNDSRVGYSTGVFFGYGSGGSRRRQMISIGLTSPRLFASMQSGEEGAVLHAEMWSNYNTTTDSNGFIKEASPIIKLFDNKIEKTNHLEIQSAALEKLGTGKYKLTGVPELSRDGWYIETPKDRNNNIYFTLDYEELDGELIIKTYEPDYSSGRAENGSPVDILEGRFVSLRFAEDPSLYPEPEEEIGEE